MTQSQTSTMQRKLVSRSGFWRWQYNGEHRQLFGPGTASTVVNQWERENRGLIGRIMFGAAHVLRRFVPSALALSVAFLLGALFAGGPNSTAANMQLRDRVQRTQSRLVARQGELALVRLENDRLTSIIDHSRRYQIPADLATSIYDISLSEGIDPKIAFALVSVESDFLRKAISHKGAVGLTQLMPATAKLLDPSLRYTDLFDQETNLRLGFRFLREMLAYYKGDLSLALTAYNRGPTRVDEIRKAGKDPSNGYAQAVLNGSQSQ